MSTPLPPLVQALSGAAGSATANALVYPLDLLATRAQLPKAKLNKRREGAQEGASRIVALLKGIVRQGGWQSLYNGLSTDTAATVVSNFFYFYIYTFLRGTAARRFNARRSSPDAKAAARVGTPTLPAPLELALGFFAGILSRAISTPLTVLTVRLQTSDVSQPQRTSGNHTRKSRLRRVAESIYAEHGLGGFWKGYIMAVPLSLNPALTFCLLQMFTRAVARSRPGSSGQSAPAPVLTPAQSFIGAACSNAAAVATLYPLMLAKTRLQAAPSTARAHNSGSGSDSSADDLDTTGIEKPSTMEIAQDMAEKALDTAAELKEKAGEVVEDLKEKRDQVVDIWRDAYQNEGVRGLYQGLEVQLAKGFFSQGVTMMVKARVEQMAVAAAHRYL